MQELMTDVSNIITAYYRNSQYDLENRVFSSTAEKPENESLGLDDIFIYEELNSLVDKASNEEAREIFSNRKVLSVICPLLKDFSGDAFELSKVVTPALIALAAAGSISFPLTGIIASAVIISITKNGISSICNERSRDED